MYSTPADWIEGLREKICSDPFDDWSLHRCSALVGRHPNHIARAFRQRYGETLGKFFRRNRLEGCCQLITVGGVALHELAHLAGFADQSHFTRAYKKAFGVTPAQHAKRLQDAVRHHKGSQPVEPEAVSDRLSGDSWRASRNALWDADS